METEETWKHVENEKNLAQREFIQWKQGGL